MKRGKLKRKHRTKGGRNSMPKKLDWIRRQRCACWATDPMGCKREVGEYISEAHHFRFLGSPATDEMVLPLCPAHHRYGKHSYENMGREGFELFHKMDITKECQGYHLTFLSTEGK